MARKTPDLAAALAAMKQASGRGRGRKSDVYQWMAARYDGLAEAFAKDPPSWTGLAKFFTDNGMLTADGLPQTAASVRSIWVRLEQAKRRRKTLIDRQPTMPLSGPSVHSAVTASTRPARPLPASD